jgi:hypothetical protein
MFTHTCQLSSVSRTAYVRHEDKFTDQDIGLLDVFCATRRIDFENRKVISLPKHEHANSSQGMYKELKIQSMRCRMYRTLKEIIHVTIKILCRRSAKQPPTNLDRTKMDPRLFFSLYDVFASFLEKLSLVSFGRDLELFFNSAVTNASKQCICVNQDNSYKLQSRKRKWRPTGQKKYYVKADTRKHIEFLRTLFGYWFGLGARLSSPKPHPTIEEGKSITHDIYMNIIAQDHWEKLQRFDERGVNGFALIYDLET